ncbi:Lipoprotein signal peptidase [Candidatus Magnetaquicoccaceae bacterium FCR-1]|uniref:Lipoprotein signal peptidase n=1 Tax=Candidatus Magnetaquiglobus chichijimensis TaxID=3141448 RepID=A0ABQ0C703_9PROT
MTMDSSGVGRPIFWGLVLAVVVFILDQWTKAIASRELLDASIVLIPGFFDLLLVHNVGAAFGLFTNLPASYRVIFLVGVASVAALVILWMLKSARSGMLVFGLGMLLGGALGNLVDRVRFGWVVDFFYVHWHDLSFPVFNLADCAITVGVGLLLLDHWLAPDPSDP